MTKQDTKNREQRAQELISRGEALINEAKELLSQPTFEPVIGWKPDKHGSC